MNIIIIDKSELINSSKQISDINITDIKNNGLLLKSSAFIVIDQQIKRFNLIKCRFSKPEMGIYSLSDLDEILYKILTTKSRLGKSLLKPGTNKPRN